MAEAGQRRRLVRRDMEEVRVQLSGGELDTPTAEMLLARYREELEGLDLEEAGRGEGGEAEVAAGSRPRRVTGALLLVAVFAAVAITAFQAVRPRDGGFITGDVTGAVDLSEVTNDQMEAVIAANPDVPEIAAMQLSLADRYFEEDDYSSALPHYLGALDGALDRTRRARALARVGWMSFRSGREDIARRFLAESLEIDPEYQEARLFLGLVLWETGDASGAVAQLEPLLAIEELPADVRAEIEPIVEAARRAAGQGT